MFLSTWDCVRVENSVSTITTHVLRFQSLFLAAVAPRMTNGLKRSQLPHPRHFSPSFLSCLVVHEQTLKLCVCLRVVWTLDCKMEEGCHVDFVREVGAAGWGRGVGGVVGETENGRTSVVVHACVSVFVRCIWIGQGGWLSWLRIYFMKKTSQVKRPHCVCLVKTFFVCKEMLGHQNFQVKSWQSKNSIHCLAFQWKPEKKFPGWNSSELYMYFHI